MFRVVGANRDTGANVDTIIDASSRADAERTASRQGILISEITEMTLDPVTPPPTPPYTPPPSPSSPPSADAPNPPISAVQRYKLRCGAKSFIFQVVLAGWTCLMGCIGVLMITTAIVTTSDKSEDRQNNAIAAGFLCPAVAYFLVALPVGMAAVLTLEKRSSRD